MNREELEGKAEALKSKIKQATRDLTNNSRLHDEGVVDDVPGKERRGRRWVASGGRPESSRTSATP